MAIDPRIALGGNPPVIAPLQLRSPIEQLGKMISIRNLMTQGQLGQLNVQQTQLENERLQKSAQEEQNLGSWMQQNQDRQDLTPQEIIAAHPNATGVKFATAWSAQQKANMEAHSAAITNRLNDQKAIDREVQGITDNPTKNAALATAVKNGWLTSDQAAPYLSMDVADPKWKDFTGRVQAQTMDAVQRAEAAKKLIELRIAQATEGAVTKKATSEATKAEQEAAGTQPITRQQKIANDLAEAATDRVTLQVGGKPHEVLVNKRTGEIVKDLGESGVKPPTFNVNAATGLLDRESARFAKPHEKSISDATSQLEKINEARSMINGPATAQALGIPKVLTALVSGQGSGVRITQAELNSIAKARGISGDIEGFIRKVSGGGTLTPEQQKQLTQVLDDAAVRLRQKQAIANDALDRINSAGSRDEIVAIDKEARRRLGDTEAGGGSQVPDAVKAVLKGAGPGIHTLSDGTKWMTAADGTITKQ